jgi:8-oxo-dGTP diphosphatase
VSTPRTPPRVVEVDGSTVEAAWVPLTDVESGAVPTVPMVREAPADHRPARVQRLAAYAVARRGHGSDAALLLTRISALGHHAGSWTLPGGGVDHGERPAAALSREVHEECGLPCEVGGLVGVHDVHFTGTAPTGRREDFHGVHLLFAVTVPADVPPRVTEAAGTTDAAAWVPVEDIRAGRVQVLEVVRRALDL